MRFCCSSVRSWWSLGPSLVVIQRCFFRHFFSDDGRTDGQTDRRTDWTSHIAAWSQLKQGKSEGFDSCDRLSNLAQIWSNSSIFQPVWPWKLMYDLEKIIGHLFYTTSSFVYHFKSIHEFKLKLQSWNAQFGSKLAIFCPVWPWNLMDDLGKQ